MSKNTRIIILSVLAVLIVIVLSIGITTAFMKPVEQGGNLTEISLSSCAKIKLTGTSSVNLSNSYPMSRNKGLQTTPYSLTVTSYCDSYVGFNLYIATLNTNTMEASNIHYILTEKGSKTAVVEGILSSATDGSSDFSDTDKTELNTGLKGTYSKIYKIHNTTVALKGNKQYDLYLFVDESSTNTSMNKTFKAGVAVKAYDREKDQTLAEYVISQYTGTQGENGIYYHNSTLANGAGDNSYRYAGESDSVNNYICLGSDEATCPDANLFRIIGVFGDQTKVIRAKSVGNQKWDTNDSNTWSSSSLNAYLNGEYLTSLGTLADKIATTTWKVGGGSATYLYDVPTTAYQYEVGSSASTTTYDAKIGLMYVSDYGFAADQSGWTTKLSSYGSNSSKNWLYLGSAEWTISRNSRLTGLAFTVTGTGYVNYTSVTLSRGVRQSFNLESSVKYVSGSGSMSDPVRVN